MAYKFMSKIIFDSAISLDGYFAGNDRGPHNPMGGVSGLIHGWMFNQKAFWEHLGMEGGDADEFTIFITLQGFK